jgi:parvulin-like peptidyl-prolyl isomerase
MKKTLLLTVALSLAASFSQAADLVEAIVIRVGDRIITRTQYSKRLADAYLELEQSTPPSQLPAKRAEVRGQLKDELVAELLVKDRADRLNLTVGSDEIKDAVDRLKKQYGLSSDKEFDEALKKSGMTRADMEARMRDTILSNKVFGHELRPREDLTDRELRERYDREKERYRLPERARLREIVILRPEGAMNVELAQKKANDVATQARVANADFAKLATQSSEVDTKEKGGDLGEVARGELLPDLDKAVFNSAAGAVIGPIATKSGWHILRVEQRLPSEVPAFESVKDKLRRDASDEAYQRDYKAYIARLRADAFVEVNDANIPAGI